MKKKKFYPNHGLSDEAIVQPVPRSGSPLQMCKLFGLNSGTMANLRFQQRGPRYYRCGKKIIYFYQDVERWIKENPVLTSDCAEMSK